MRGLSVLYPRKPKNAGIYFDGDRVAMTAISEPPIRPDDITVLMPNEIVELRSRQGNRAMIKLDATAGIAFSASDDEVGFLEVFPATTPDQYRAEIWFEPPAFRK